MTMDTASRAGELLKQGRLKQRLSLSECAKRTHIAQHYLESLEESRWEQLPSESHRRGFLYLYARFLGLSAADIMARYQEECAKGASLAPKAERPPVENTPVLKRSFYPESAGQLIAVAIGLLVLTWGAYHALSRGLPDRQPVSWSRPRPIVAEPRLQTGKITTGQQKIRIVASETSWMRISQRRHLLFEGLLYQGAQKEWSGPGPYQVKLAKANAVQVFWNDQPVDTSRGSRGGINTLMIPTSR